MKFKAWQYCLSAVLLIMALLVIGCSGAAPEKPTATPHATTAMEGYKIAENEALAWNVDATLGYAMGLSLDAGGNRAPIDGTANTWLYAFASASAKKKFLVKVTNGSIDTMYEHVDDPATDSAGFSNDYGARPMADWKVDSTGALRAALPAYEAHYGGNPALARYILENNGDNRSGKANFYWSIDLYPEQTSESNASTGTPIGNESLTVYIDPMNGTVLPQDPAASAPYQPDA